MTDGTDTTRSARRIAVSGATGLVGSALCEALEARGGEPVPIVRRVKDIPGEVLWDTDANTFGAESLAACDAVVHLAGENIMGRWSDEKKRAVRDSRVNSTAALSRALAGLDNGPKTFICASAIGYYGDTGQSDARTENDPAGDDFLAEVCVAWEAATATAKDAGIRVVNLRIGIVLSSQSGALKTMLTPFRLGMGGRVGSGRQWMSWVSLADMVGIIMHALDSPDVSGPVNAVAPGAVTNAAFTKALGKALGRPTLLPVPAFVPRLALGREAADALVLGSIRVRPDRLAETRYRLQHPDLDSALRWALTKDQ